MHMPMLGNLLFLTIVVFHRVSTSCLASTQSFFISPVFARLNNSNRHFESPQKDKDTVKVVGSILLELFPK